MEEVEKLLAYEIPAGATDILLERIRERRAVPFLGAGVSASVIPTWQYLLRDVWRVKFGGKGREKDAAMSFESACKALSGDLERVTEVLLESCSAHEFQRIVKHLFGLYVRRRVAVEKIRKDATVAAARAARAAAEAQLKAAEAKAAAAGASEAGAARREVERAHAAVQDAVLRVRRARQAIYDVVERMSHSEAHGALAATGALKLHSQVLTGGYPCVLTSNWDDLCEAAYAHMRDDVFIPKEELESDGPDISMPHPFEGDDTGDYSKAQPPQAEAGGRGGGLGSPSGPMSSPAPVLGSVGRSPSGLVLPPTAPPSHGIATASGRSTSSTRGLTRTTSWGDGGGGADGDPAAGDSPTIPRAPPTTAERADLRRNLRQYFHRMSPRLPVYYRRQVPELFAALRGGRTMPRLFKIHGDLSDEGAKEFVSSHSDFRRLVVRDVAGMHLMRYLSANYSYVFAGCSLSDSDLLGTIDDTVEAFSSVGPHFWITNADDVPKLKARFLLKNYSVMTIAVKGGPGKYERTAQLLGLVTRLGWRPHRALRFRSVRTDVVDPTRVSHASVSVDMERSGGYPSFVVPDTLRHRPPGEGEYVAFALPTRPALRVHRRGLGTALTLGTDSPLDVFLREFVRGEGGVESVDQMFDLMPDLMRMLGTRLAVAQADSDGDDDMTASGGGFVPGAAFWRARALPRSALQHSPLRSALKLADAWGRVNFFAVNFLDDATPVNAPRPDEPPLSTFIPGAAVSGFRCISFTDLQLEAAKKLSELSSVSHTALQLDSAETRASLGASTSASAAVTALQQHRARHDAAEDDDDVDDDDQVPSLPADAATAVFGLARTESQAVRIMYEVPADDAPRKPGLHKQQQLQQQQQLHPAAGGGGGTSGGFGGSGSGAAITTISSSSSSLAPIAVPASAELASAVVAMRRRKSMRVSKSSVSTMPVSTPASGGEIERAQAAALAAAELMMGRGDSEAGDLAILRDGEDEASSDDDDDDDDVDVDVDGAHAAALAAAEDPHAHVVVRTGPPPPPTLEEEDEEDDDTAGAAATFRKALRNEHQHQHQHEQQQGGPGAKKAEPGSRNDADAKGVAASASNGLVSSSSAAASATSSSASSSAASAAAWSGGGGGMALKVSTPPATPVAATPKLTREDLRRIAEGEKALVDADILARMRRGVFEATRHLLVAAVSDALGLGTTSPDGMGEMSDAQFWRRLRRWERRVCRRFDHDVTSFASVARRCPSCESEEREEGEDEGDGADEGRAGAGGGRGGGGGAGGAQRRGGAEEDVGKHPEDVDSDQEDEARRRSGGSAVHRKGSDDASSDSSDAAAAVAVPPSTTSAGPGGASAALDDPDMDEDLRLALLESMQLQEALEMSRQMEAEAVAATAPAAAAQRVELPSAASAAPGAVHASTPPPAPASASASASASAGAGAATSIAVSASAAPASDDAAAPPVPPARSSAIKASLLRAITGQQRDDDDVVDSDEDEARFLPDLTTRSLHRLRRQANISRSKPPVHDADGAAAAAAAADEEAGGDAHARRSKRAQRAATDRAEYEAFFGHVAGLQRAGPLTEEEEEEAAEREGGAAVRGARAIDWPQRGPECPAVLDGLRPVPLPRVRGVSRVRVYMPMLGTDVGQLDHVEALRIMLSAIGDFARELHRITYDDLRVVVSILVREPVLMTEVAAGRIGLGNLLSSAYDGWMSLSLVGGATVEDNVAPRVVRVNMRRGTFGDIQQSGGRASRLPSGVRKHGVLLRHGITDGAHLVWSSVLGYMGRPTAPWARAASDTSALF